MSLPDKHLTVLWELPESPELSSYFLLKWHRDYLRDKTHYDLEEKTGSLVPYIYRDETKFYMLFYGTTQEVGNDSTDFFWLSFRKAKGTYHGYVLIKRAQPEKTKDYD